MNFVRNAPSPRAGCTLGINFINKMIKLRNKNKFVFEITKNRSSRTNESINSYN